jgi:RNA polymerase sigma-70 factor (ECF subfamily)
VSREVFLAHRLDDLSYPQIAKRTGLTVAEVERHIAEAILHLDRALREMEREDRT